MSAGAAAIGRTSGARVYPATPYQSWLYGVVSDPAANDAYKAIHTLFWAVRVTPGLQVRRLQRAFDTVVGRHDTLRMRFVPGRAGARVEIQPHHPVGLIVEDHGLLEEAAITDLVTVYAGREIPVEADALFEMRLLRFGAAGDALVMRAQHAVMDGYGIALFIEELVKALLGLPITTRPVSHADHLRRLTAQFSADGPRKQAYWAGILDDTPAPIVLGRAARGLDRLGPGTERRTLRRADPLAPGERTELLNWVRSRGLSLYAHVYASFAETLLQMSGGDRLLAECVVGRNDPALAGYVGAALQQIPVPVMAAPGLNAGDRAARFNAHLTEAVTHLPYDFRASSAHQAALQGSDWGRYLVHMPFPRAQLRRSEFWKLFSGLEEDGVTFWNYTFKLMDIPRPLHCLEELYCNLTEQDRSYDLFLASEAASFDETGLDGFARAFRAQLLAFRSD